MFKDIDKSKPVKLYTDSPVGTILMTNDHNGLQEELKVSVTKFNVRFDKTNSIKQIGS